MSSTYGTRQKDHSRYEIGRRITGEEQVWNKAEGSQEKASSRYGTTQKDHRRR